MIKNCPFFLFKPKTLRRGASSESLLLTFAKNQFNSERYDVTKTFATEGVYTKCVQEGKMVYIKYILSFTDRFQLLQKEYIKVLDFYEIHVFH